MKWSSFGDGKGKMWSHGKEGVGQGGVIHEREESIVRENMCGGIRQMCGGKTIEVCDEGGTTSVKERMLCQEDTNSQKGNTHTHTYSDSIYWNKRAVHM